jgi:ferredoxin-type protein NapG
LDRRQFFRRGFNNIANVMLTAAEEQALRKARNWLRPPFAVDELDFLSKCTRCDACIEACPHQVIFSLTQVQGGTAAGTPALDLVNKGCHLCSDWPCLNACETGALERPDVVDEAHTIDEDSAPGLSLTPDQRLSDVSIDIDQCLPYLGPECGACLGSCPVSALTWQGTKPNIDQTLCVGCALCREACITEPKSISIAKTTPSNQVSESSDAGL